MKLLLFIILILISCKPTEKSVSGTYNRYWDFENYAKLNLERDKTFSFIMQEGLIFYQLDGIWTINKNKLILNSSKDSYTATKSMILNKKKIDKSGLKLFIYNDESELPGATIYVFTQGHVKLYSTHERGQFYSKNEKWDSVLVNYVGFKPLKIKADKENMYEIQLIQEEALDIKFENKEFIIRGRKLIDPNIKEYKRKNTYKRTVAN